MLPPKASKKILKGKKTVDKKMEKAKGSKKKTIKEYRESSEKRERIK
jgi:hypothetical protein